MTEEEARQAKITRSEALRELEKHGVIDLTDFYSEVGKKSEYAGFEILNFLGY